MSTASDPSALTAEGTATYRQQVEEAAAALPHAQSSPPTVGVLHDVEIDPLLHAGSVEDTVSYADLPHYPVSEGTLTIGTVAGTRIVELDQNLHLYDGHTPREVTFPIRMLAMAGVDTLLLAATAGSVAPQFERGDLMMLTDHINFQGQNPLVGPNVEAWGPRFPDMTTPYAASLRRRAVDAAQNEGVSLQKGVYLALLGPNRETTAEHRMGRRLGADAVGTGVVPEVIAARHMDLQVLALTLLTDQYLTAEGEPASAETEDKNLSTVRSHLRRLLLGVLGESETEKTTT